MVNREAKVMARTSTLPRRTQRAWLLLATIALAVVVVAVSVAAWAFFLRSNDTPARSVPAATSPSATSQGPRTDPIPVNPPALDGAAILQYYEQHPECATPSPSVPPGC